MIPPFYKKEKDEINKYENEIKKIKRKKGKRNM